jgi:hypothetical protein
MSIEKSKVSIVIINLINWRMGKNKQYKSNFGKKIKNLENEQRRK